ncbi:MAG TPA: zinc dependent phospholipase C family protein [Nitrospirota bacterium]
MPASIVHMLIAREVRTRIRRDPSLGCRSFLTNLPEYEACMNLGSLGPDLPYFSSRIKGILNLVFERSDKPMGVDQWSYQMHSKDPNVFPLKMIEIIWKESAIEKEDWDEEDHRKFAFVCGYLTHMAADQVIHPVVNLIAGPYYKRGDARKKHRDCEVYQDVFAFGEIVKDRDFRLGGFNSWCDIAPGSSDNAPVWFRYLLQKAFVEAHAVMPAGRRIENWIDGTLVVLRFIARFGPYVTAYDALKDPESEKKKEYIDLVPPGDSPDDLLSMCGKVIGHKRYMDFFREAVDLACVYVEAALRVYDLDELGDEDRAKFKAVVRNADLTAPLEENLLSSALAALG